MSFDDDGPGIGGVIVAFVIIGILVTVATCPLWAPMLAAFLSL